MTVPVFRFIDLMLQASPQLDGDSAQTGLDASRSVVCHALHTLLAHNAWHDVGVDFPQMTGLDPGAAIRLHGPGDKLATLVDGRWLGGARDRVLMPLSIGSDVPVGFCSVWRVRVFGGSARRRYRRRFGTVDKSGNLCARPVPGAVTSAKAPTIWLWSSSSARMFPLRIRRVRVNGDDVGSATPRTFSTYGLGAAGFLPFFRGDVEPPEMSFTNNVLQPTADRS